MAFTHVIFVALLAVSYCLSLPIIKDTDLITEDAKVTVDKITKRTMEQFELVQLLSVDSESAPSHMIVKRSKRGGIIHGGACPEGEGSLPSGECTPCQGRSLPGCPTVSYDDDYYEENQV